MREPADKWNLKEDQEDKSMRVTVETQRLVLRPFVPEDYEEAFKWCGDPAVNTYMIYPL